MVFFSSAEDKVQHENDLDSGKTQGFEKMDAITEKYAKIARAKGWDGTLLTQEEKELASLEFDKKKVGLAKKVKKN